MTTSRSIEETERDARMVIRDALDAAAEFHVTVHEGEPFVMPDRGDNSKVAWPMSDWREWMDEAIAELDSLLERVEELEKERDEPDPPVRLRMLGRRSVRLMRPDGRDTERKE